MLPYLYEILASITAHYKLQETSMTENQTMTIDFLICWKLDRLEAVDLSDSMK